jgi:hypothetical protein
MLLVTISAHAVCLNGQPSVAEEYKAAKAVVVARVVRQRGVPVSGDSFYDDGTMYTVKVERAFRGNVGAEADIFSENTSGRFPMAVGARYLLFIGKRHERLVVDYCGNSGLLSQRRKELKSIEGLHANR